MQSTTSEIRLKIQLDENKIPQKLSWSASDTQGLEKECKAINLSIWDAADKDTLRVDLWTKDLQVDEMSTHFLQTLISLAETYEKATGIKNIVNETKSFCMSLAKQISEHSRS
ncbi:MAG TPA: gliding motility protein GldC [Chitinophagales bacterium]|nr:gliding motility protein GldC [Chitinophagales bacterium]